MTKVNSLLKYSGDFSANYDPRTVPDVAYVDSKFASINSALKLKGSINGSTGTINAPVIGDIGDTYYVTGAPANGSAFYSQTLRNGDAIIVVTAYSGSSSTAANFIVLEKNDDVATTAIAGLIQIATQAIANAGTDNAQAITALTLAGALANGLYTKKLTANNPLLNTVSGACTWTIPNTLGSADMVVQVIESSTGNVVLTDINITSANITVTFSSSTNIAANSYKVVAIGI
jgi:hypothetical protein